MHPCREFRRRKVATHPSLPLEGSRRDGLRHQRCTCCATHGTHAFRKAVPSLSVTYGRKGELQHNTHRKRLSAGDNSTANHHPCCQTTTDLSAPMATVADPKRLFKKRNTCQYFTSFFVQSPPHCLHTIQRGSAHLRLCLVHMTTTHAKHKVHRENRHPCVKLPMCDHVGEIDSDKS